MGKLIVALDGIGLIIQSDNYEIDIRYGGGFQVIGENSSQEQEKQTAQTA